MSHIKSNVIPIATSAPVRPDMVSEEGARFVADRASKLDAVITDYPETKFDAAVERFLDNVTNRALPILLIVVAVLTVIVIGHQTALSLGIIR